MKQGKNDKAANEHEVEKSDDKLINEQIKKPTKNITRAPLDSMKYATRPRQDDLADKVIKMDLPDEQEMPTQLKPNKSVISIIEMTLKVAKEGERR